MRARVLVTRSLSDLHLEGLDSALASLQDARLAARSCRSPYALTLTDAQEGTIWMSLGEWRKGLGVLRTLDLAALRNPREVISLLLNRGLAQVTLLEFEPGRIDLARALRLAQDHSLRTLEFKCRHNLGYLEYVAGDLPRAIAAMREADEMSVEVDRVRARHDFGRVMLEAGLVSQAHQLLSETAEHARDRDQRLDEGEILLDLARADILVDRLDCAATHAGEAATAFHARADLRRAERARLVQRVVRLTRDAEAVDASQEGEPGAGPDDGAGDSLTRIARILTAEAQLRRGDTSGARATLATLPNVTHDGLGAEMHERFVRAWLADLDGDTRAVGRQIRTARAHLERQRGRNPSLELRAGLSVHGRRIAELDLSRALRTGRPRSVFESVDRWRGASQLVASLHPDDDPEIAALVSELRLRRAQAVTEEDPQELRMLGRTIPVLERRLEQHAWSRAGLGNIPTARVSYPRVRDQLTQRLESMLIYVTHVGRHYCVVLGRRRAVLVQLPRCDLDALAARLRRDVRARALARGTDLEPMVSRAVASSLRALDEVLLRPVARYLDQGLVIAPTRMLTSLPWSMLPTARTRPVTVTPAIGRWSRYAPTTGMRVAALAGPSVPHAAEEIEAIASVWHNANLSTSTDATSTQLIEAIAAPGVLHVAAHGHHEEQSPMFSSLWMSDGPVFAHELARVGASHVVLSACDVGQAQIRPGDEPLGFVAALLARGVASVVAAVAPIDDLAAAEAMPMYHRELASGVGAAEALARVRQQVPAAALLSVYGSDWKASGISPG